MYWAAFSILPSRQFRASKRHTHMFIDGGGCALLSFKAIHYEHHPRLLSRTCMRRGGRSGLKLRRRFCGRGLPSLLLWTLGHSQSFTVSISGLSVPIRRIGGGSALSSMPKTSCQSACVRTWMEGSVRGSAGTGERPAVRSLEKLPKSNLDLLCRGNQLQRGAQEAHTSSRPPSF